MVKKISLKNIDGIISAPEIEGRFQEILSLQKIKDTKTGILYDGLIDTDFLILINELNAEYERLGKLFTQESQDRSNNNVE